MAADLAHRIAFALENARLFQETKQAVSARDEFLSIASHELRTPLTALTLLMQRWQLANERNGTSDSRSLLVRSVRQVQRLTTLVENLLDVSRLASGRLTLSPEKLDLTELSREVANRLREEAAQAHCPLHFEAREPVIGSWDRMRIEQVLTNLFTNAIKYGAGKPIEIQVASEGGVAVFRIRDHGIGIDGHRLPFIFDRFERAVSSRDYGGLGLGLYIARQIVDAHGGDIRVVSQPGDGSTFAVALPAVANYRHMVVKADPRWNQEAQA
jgi:signal transduction histidine kinase